MSEYTPHINLVKEAYIAYRDDVPREVAFAEFTRFMAEESAQAIRFYLNTKHHEKETL